jgi:hypothetical protein
MKHFLLVAAISVIALFTAQSVNGQNGLDFGRNDKKTETKAPETKTQESKECYTNDYQKGELRTNSRSTTETNSQSQSADVKAVTSGANVGGSAGTGNSNSTTTNEICVPKDKLKDDDK